MPHDRIFIKHDGEWLERGDAEEQHLSDEFESDFDRLNAKGNYVILAKGCSGSDEDIFLFENARDATEFFEIGFRQWEWISEIDGEDCSFHAVTMLRADNLPSQHRARRGGARSVHES